MTPQTQRVLGAMLERDDHRSYGLEIVHASGLPPGTIYPILQRLLAAGWVVDWWEDEAVTQREGRPRRRYYQLTAHGAARAVHALSQRPDQWPRLSRLFAPDPPGPLRAGLEHGSGLDLRARLDLGRS
jgi:DNA-binding PadR family transcriptional regulator